MEIEVPGAKPISAVGRDRRFLCQQAVAVVEYLQGTRILGPAARGIVAARDQNREPIVRRYAYLVAVHPEVERTRLFDFPTERPVTVDAVDTQRARIVEGDQHV